VADLRFRQQAASWRCDREPPADRPASGLDTLANLCASRLGELIARPVRAEDDWAIAWRDTCGCELCVPFGEVLGDNSRRILEWPLAEARRKHIQQETGRKYRVP
jgi:hypothetical protein